ncbi:hypothetical protein [Shewanella acanthi]|uniref:hypothetical protein n=1 Tax=Shewanella acanthi TaxID=2864212 RepID=UPI001C65D60E|nr:hypothetical protein [Shewanella acanthi]QYJ79435.1 hypothetical protein K0H61_03020 [Shewanella acanthi]
MITLRFTKAWTPQTSPIVLRFGGDDGGGTGEPVAQELRINAGLSWATLKAIEQHITLTMQASAIDQRIDSQWQGEDIERREQLSWASSPVARRFTYPWQMRVKHTRRLPLRWTSPVTLQTRPSLSWQDGERKQQLTRVVWSCYPVVQLRHSSPWLTGADVQRKCQSATAMAWNSQASVKAAHYLQWGPTRPRYICSNKWLDFAPKGKVKLRFSAPYTNKQSPLSLRFDTVPTVCHWDYGGGRLNANPVLPNLDFKIPIQPQIRRYYLMQPTITCIRVSDSLPIVISSVTLSQSRDQWARSVSIEFSSRIDAERAHNALLLISINGYDFYAKAEQPSSSKVFGTPSYSSNGRSRVAELAAPAQRPISYTNTIARSFGGILGDILQYTDWSIELDEAVPDFVVPAGAFSVGNKTPIEAINEAVTQVGCMLLSDDSAQTLTVVPRWPTSPWAMAAATPDIALHDGVIFSYQAAVNQSPLCDVVWLRGEQQGIQAKVKRAGSAGTNAAQDISAQLIVDNQAARLAGTDALAETGDKNTVSLTLPLRNDLPPVSPGMFVGLTKDGELSKGLCDSWSLRATVSDRGDIDIEQSITVLVPLE